MTFNGTKPYKISNAYVAFINNNGSSLSPETRQHDIIYTNLSIITKGNMINFLCANYFDAQKKIIVKK